jgi:hypothetical protein
MSYLQSSTESQAFNAKDNNCIFKKYELVSPCVNTRKVVCPNRNYPKCISTCIPMQEFKEHLSKEPCFLTSSHCEGSDYSLYFQTDGVVGR